MLQFIVDTTNQNEQGKRWTYKTHKYYIKFDNSGKTAEGFCGGERYKRHKPKKSGSKIMLQKLVFKQKNGRKNKERLGTTKIIPADVQEDQCFNICG